MNYDWTTAEAIQRRLLPCGQIRFRDLEWETYYRPFHSIGGDYYDFVRLDRHRIGFAIGDVSGKGVEAALLMASVQASLRAHVVSQNSSAPALVRRLNQLLYESSLPYMYATLFYGEYNADTRSLTYINAGHNSPLILRQERDRVRLIQLMSEGPPIGVLRDAVYQGTVCSLHPGDVFFAYTDGLTESSNETQELWGQERLATILSKCVAKRPRDIIRAILGARDEFARPIAPVDDMTLVVASVGRRPTMDSLDLKITNDLETATACRDVSTSRI
jgi:sigma-B regulation protein RsbU (phosphoserine phosphatase)